MRYGRDEFRGDPLGPLEQFARQIGELLVVDNFLHGQRALDLTQLEVFGHFDSDRSGKLHVLLKHGGHKGERDD